MKGLHTSHRAKGASVACSLLILILPVSLLAQKNSAGPVAGAIQCSIKTETESWSRDKSIPIIVSIKNISDKPVNLVGIYALQLTRSNESRDGKSGTAYWAPVDIRTGSALSLVRDAPKSGGKVPKASIHLEPAESREIRLHVDKLFWNLSFSSVWPNQSLFEAVPSGAYDLIFDIETDGRNDAQGYPLVTHVKSNRVKAIIR